MKANVNYVRNCPALPYGPALNDHVKFNKYYVIDLYNAPINVKPTTTFIRAEVGGMDH